MRRNRIRKSGYKENGVLIKNKRYSDYFVNCYKHIKLAGGEVRWEEII